ncbi:related to PQ loop repeat protein [Ramularia collo-cygni]|uniref:Related to PQ loop repeat protein n=1 Tax=Ramularia collo-cygni TaxID=112498 RepID=A0A2D3VER8_9PEZI|nr:related to PQ loop repeat protein [Ramularia collo-cygni]CZT21344.1 related to PQ loop repeat protein [Ramularia collo-cygni]
MFPPSGSYSVDIEAISGICGSISIACWVVVFSPQIVENFRRSSAEGLSVEFIIIWLAGDVFNILGAVLQGVLPTMIVLAIYYTFADIVLLGQCFYYRGFTLRDPRPDKPGSIEDAPNERSPLITNGHANGQVNGNAAASRPPNAADVEYSSRNRSRSSFRERLSSLDASFFSPATPIHPQPKDAPDGEVLKPQQARSLTHAILFNGAAILVVVAAGIAGYYLSPATPEAERSGSPADDQAQSLKLNLWGQVFGYICAVLYLGSRVPQLLLNYRRKSTEGLNALFFLFACIGNLTYVWSILAFEPICSRHSHGHWRVSHCHPGEASSIYGQYILVNLSWLIGSLGTLFLDGAVFIQFWMYRSGNEAILDDDDRGRSAVER